MKQLVIHAGTPKTATSTIQRSLFENRDWLKAHGILYATQYRKMRALSHHHVFAHSIAKDGKKAAALLSRLRRSSCERTVISSEVIYLGARGRRLYDCAGAYWDDRFRYLDRLATATVDFERVIVLIFRRPDEVAESLYSTAIRQDAVRMSFPDFREHIGHLLEYERQAAAFRERFEKVEVRDYVEMRPAIVANAFAAMGLPVPSRLSADRNVSPDPHAVLWLEKHLHGNPTPQQRQSMRDFIESDGCSRFFRSRSTLWESQEARKAYCARFGWPDLDTPDLPLATLTPELEVELDSAHQGMKRQRRFFFSARPAF